MALPIDPRAHVEDDAGASLLPLAGFEKLQAQLRFADSSGAGDVERAGNQPAAQSLIQRIDAGR